MEFQDSNGDEDDNFSPSNEREILELTPRGNENGMEEEVETSHNEVDEEGDEMVILDPHHPLMERVQAALKDQLTRQNEKLEIQFREKAETLKKLQIERENLGIELYSIQQQLARHQMLVEAEQDKQVAMNQIRTQKDASLNQVREHFHKTQELLKIERKQTLQLRQEMENANARLRYISEAHETVKKDIALTKRAAEKTTIDVTRAQDIKLKQDIFVDRLTNTIHKHEEQLALYDAQCSAQALETKAIREAVNEASMELETVLLEKKKLMTQWNSALIGMRRRDEAYAAMLSAINQQKQEIRSVETEVENYKKHIIKEEERNENLTMVLNKANADIAHVKKQIDTSVAKRDQLKADYMTYTRTLQETEQSLAKANTDCTLKRNELSTIRTQTEREALEKRNLEDSVMEKMMQRLTMDKASQYTRRTIDKVRKRSEELETAVVSVENETAATLLQIADVTSRLKRLQQSVDEQNAAMQNYNTLISRAEREITKNNALVERKQTQIDQLNKKIDQTMSKLGGGEDLGPLELKIETMKKQIINSVDECNEMQQFWLRQQNELVKRTRNSEEQRRALDSCEKQLLILNQKKLRIDGQLAREKYEEAQVEHNISSIQKDIMRLNTLITEKKGEQEELEHRTFILENDFIHALKDEELVSIQLQGKMDQMKEEKERVLNSLVEAEQQIMLWERKIQIAKEMKAAVDSGIGQAEVRAMKAEIHRMEVRHEQLMRQQEKMIQDMEKSVYRRESLLSKGEAQAKCGKKDQTQGHYKRKILDLQRQIKLTAKDGARMEEQFHELESSLQGLAQTIEEVRRNCQLKTAALDNIQVQVNYAEDNKKKGLSELISSQSKVKYMTAAKEGKYRLLNKSEESREAEWQRQLTKLQSLQAIVEQLQDNFPNCGGKLRNIALSIKSRLGNNSHPQTEGEVTVA